MPDTTITDERHECYCGKRATRWRLEWVPYSPLPLACWYCPEHFLKHAQEDEDAYRQQKDSKP